MAKKKIKGNLEENGTGIEEGGKNRNQENAVLHIPDSDMEDDSLITFSGISSKLDSLKDEISFIKTQTEILRRKMDSLNESENILQKEIKRMERKGRFFNSFVSVLLLALIALAISALAVSCDVKDALKNIDEESITNTILENLGAGSKVPSNFELDEGVTLDFNSDYKKLADYTISVKRNGTITVKGPALPEEGVSLFEADPEYENIKAIYTKNGKTIVSVELQIGQNTLRFSFV